MQVNDIANAMAQMVPAGSAFWKCKDTLTSLLPFTTLITIQQAKRVLNMCNVGHAQSDMVKSMVQSGKMQPISSADIRFLLEKLPGDPPFWAKRDMIKQLLKVTKDDRFDPSDLTAVSDDSEILDDALARFPANELLRATVASIKEVEVKKNGSGLLIDVNGHIVDLNHMQIHETIHLILGTSSAKITRTAERGIKVVGNGSIVVQIPKGSRFQSLSVISSGGSSIITSGRVGKISSGVGNIDFSGVDPKDAKAVAALFKSAEAEIGEAQSKSPPKEDAKVRPSAEDMNKAIPMSLASEPVGECSICLDQPSEGCFLPCRHKACCMPCGMQIAKTTGICPICRKNGEFLHISKVSAGRVFAV